MFDTDVLIVGGGPAGVSCARRLIQQGLECLILDKQSFPREKLCAGWITPGVLQALEITREEYPYSFTEFDHFRIHYKQKEFSLKVKQYAIRRFEFDEWNLKRSGAAVEKADVVDIKETSHGFVINDLYRGKYLVGAGGTHCPVRRTFFQKIDREQEQTYIVALEQEFRYDYSDDKCHLWFSLNGLPGYAWYVPKKDGYVNVGLGAWYSKLKQTPFNLKDHWDEFVGILRNRSLVSGIKLQPKGHNYYARSSRSVPQVDRVYLAGDAYGMATVDMGEGIGPAIKSGLLAADSIVYDKPYRVDSIRKYSFSRFPLLLRLGWKLIF